LSIPIDDAYNPARTEQHQKHGTFSTLLRIATRCSSSSPTRTDSSNE
jgi:hypothetical protein